MTNVRYLLLAEETSGAWFRTRKHVAASTTSVVDGVVVLQLPLYVVPTEGGGKLFKLAL